MRKIIEAIPNTITLCNLFCGCLATVAAFEGSTNTAVYFILAGAAFDFCDGFVARLLGVQSPLGLQLDSLADLVTFGIAPSAIVYHLSDTSGLPLAVSCAAFFLAVFSALRLARFNIDERQTSSFVGLPTPASALAVCGAAFDVSFTTARFVPLLVPALCFLLVCNLPMFSLKVKRNALKLDPANSLRLLQALASAAFIALLGLRGLFPAIVLYILLSVITRNKQY
jgi:CDP-diacylglycerol--serine O-phosphatidyltransferase